MGPTPFYIGDEPSRSAETRLPADVQGSASERGAAQTRYGTATVYENARSAEYRIGNAAHHRRVTFLVKRHRGYCERTKTSLRESMLHAPFGIAARI